MTREHCDCCDDVMTPESSAQTRKITLYAGIKSGVRISVKDGGVELELCDHCAREIAAAYSCGNAEVILARTRGTRERA